MKLVILESPYGGDTTANIAYARACVRDSLLRGESPLASHLLYTQPGILDDNNPEERRHGINAGHAWMLVAERVVIYIDRGISAGMLDGINMAEFQGVPIEHRRLHERY